MFYALFITVLYRLIFVETYFIISSDLFSNGGESVDLSVSIKQSLSISPQLIQNLEILQMGSQQLLEYIQQLAEENPTIDLNEAYSEQNELDQFRLKLMWLRQMDVQNKVYYNNDNDYTDPFSTVSSEDETLSDYLMTQLGEADIPNRLKRAAEFVAMSLNESGWLTESAESLASGSGFSEDEIAGAVNIIQSLDPPGVGAVDLRSCLILQLERLDFDTVLAQRIVNGHLQDMANKSEEKLASMLGTSVEYTEHACQLIRSLNPRPSSGFASKHSTVYITPDIIVVSFPDHFEILTNDYYFPTVKINTYYMDMFSKTDSDDVKKYLNDKLRQAKSAISGIDQRKTMLLRCAEQIVAYQQEFFRGGNLRPMTMSDLAAALDVHESTVSRAVKDKFLQCSRGVYPLSRFFSRALGEDGSVSAAMAKELIRKMVDDEDEKAPLSDNKISENLSRKGVDISRRTVAKYRSELGIAAAAVRRQQKKTKT